MNDMAKRLTTLMLVPSTPKRNRSKPSHQEAERIDGLTPDVAEALEALARALRDRQASIDHVHPTPPRRHSRTRGLALTLAVDHRLMKNLVSIQHKANGGDAPKRRRRHSKE